MDQIPLMILFVIIVELICWCPVLLITFIYIKIRDRDWHKYLDRIEQISKANKI